MANPTHPVVQTNNKDRVSDQNDGRYADKNKTPDKAREDNKENPDGKKMKDGSNCGC